MLERRRGGGRGQKILCDAILSFFQRELISNRKESHMSYSMDRVTSPLGSTSPQAPIVAG